MRRTASEILRNLEVRIGRLEAMRRTASMRRASYSFSKSDLEEIVDMINDDLDTNLTYRDTAIDIEEDGSGKSGTTYLLCSVEDENTGKTYYFIASVIRGKYDEDWEMETNYDNWNDAKSDFDRWTR